MDYSDDFAGYKKHEEEPPVVVEISAAPVPVLIQGGLLIGNEFQNNQTGVVYIKTLKGHVLSIPAEAGDLIKTIKDKIKHQIQRDKLSNDELNLLYAGLNLKDDRSLSDYRIRDGATIHLLLGKDDPQQIINESHSALEKGELEVNLLYQEQTFKVDIKDARTVKELKVLVANTLLCSAQDFVLLYGGRLLLKEEEGLKECKIANHSNILAIPTSDGGACLSFTQIVMETLIKDLDYLKLSLEFLSIKHAIEDFVNKALAKIANIKKQKPQFQNAPEEGLVSIMLWTSNLFYKALNRDLMKSGDFSKWNVYLKNLMNGLKAMPYYRGTVYRGFKDYRDLKIYQKGKLVTWTTVSALSRNRTTAKGFSNSAGTLFEVEVFSARDISSVSVYTTEEEVIMLPHSCFEVTDVIEKSGEAVLVKLKEVPTPRAPKVVFWTDDNPENNHTIAKQIENNNDSCVFCISTKDALKVIETYRWLLYFENANFRIITDMVRDEDGKKNFTAGIDLVEELMKKYKYNFEVLIFCTDTKRAKENCDAKKLNGRFSITASFGEVQQFLNFK